MGVLVQNSQILHNSGMGEVEVPLEDSSQPLETTYYSFGWGSLNGALGGWGPQGPCP